MIAVASIASSTAPDNPGPLDDTSDQQPSDSESDSESESSPEPSEEDESDPEPAGDPLAADYDLLFASAAHETAFWLLGMRSSYLDTLDPDPDKRV